MQNYDEQLNMYTNITSYYMKTTETVSTFNTCHLISNDICYF